MEDDAGFLEARRWLGEARVQVVGSGPKTQGRKEEPMGLAASRCRL